MKKAIQCKHIPTQPILDFLDSIAPMWGTWFDKKFDNSVLRAMPEGTPPKLAWVKMNSLIKRGIVTGCDCGCRGDYLVVKGVPIEKEAK